MRFFRKHTIASVATDPTTPIDRLLASLPTGPADLAVLAGAGISLDSPSNLLSGWNFMDAVLSRVMPNEVDRETRRSLISVPRDRQFRPGEYIRFETLMMELESSIDPGLHVLDCLDECAHPNVSHYVLAELLRRGAIVMTTNFDRLIEIAFERTMKPGEPALRVVHDNARFETTDSTDAQTPTLWKLHGSLTVDGKATRESVQATLVQVMSPSLSGNKRGFLRGVLASKDLLVVGYSGSDDLDIVPVLANTPSDRSMLWLQHVAGGAAKFETAAQLVANHKAISEFDVVGRDRVFFVRQAAHQADQTVALVSWATPKLIQVLRQRYCGTLEIPVDREEFEFGERYPAVVKRYFDDWVAGLSLRPSDRYRIAIAMLGNRCFRADVKPLYESLRQEHRKIIDSAGAIPEERFDALMERFNRQGEEEELSSTANQALVEKLSELLPHLPKNSRGGAHRLSACALWNQERYAEAETRFRLAWEADKSSGRLNQEIATLTTWQSATSTMRDHLSEWEHHQLNELAKINGQRIFPDDAYYRLRALAEQTGYKLDVWAHLLSTFDMGYVEEDPHRRSLVRKEARDMLRASIDMGDVIGEAKTRLLLALSLHESEEFEEATLHVLSLLELGKVISLGEFDPRARALLTMMGTAQDAARAWPTLAESIWH